MTSQAQAQEFAGATATVTTEPEAPASTRNEVSVRQLVASYVDNCGEVLDPVRQALESMRAFRDHALAGRAAVDRAAPFFIDLLKRRREAGKAVETVYAGAVADLSKVFDDPEVQSDALLGAFDDHAATLAAAIADRDAQLERIELSLGLVAAMFGEKVVQGQIERVKVYDLSLASAEAFQIWDAGTDSLWSELNRLQAFEVASYDDLDAGQAYKALQWWIDLFKKANPVREQFTNIVELFTSSLNDVMTRLDHEFKYGFQPDTSDWVDSVLGVLDTAILTAEESLAALASHKH